METTGASVLMCIITGLHNNIPMITWKINDSTVLQKHTVIDIFKEADNTFTALGLFYPTPPSYKLKRDDVYRCEVEQKGESEWMCTYNEVSTVRFHPSRN
ncbi:hypothetical protein QTP70_006207 [Hemibagrus guttatus]|uniref:Ig-like domain-containing protein n=1 Tax=Hemibagrus guttatus TaxID=175788 RepID=A0AAE0QU69_9TELE|nr:hypothetical protein QTP70_006207 [Hemibagrus guttatus]KAK3561664.1 hypothetical protein QTP86_012495 [Hemibagrus guttatus]